MASDPPVQTQARDPRIDELHQKVQEVKRLLEHKRRPLFIEFAGTPKAGKTLALNTLAMFLKRNGIAVQVYQERASVAPLMSKGSPLFNTWVTCASLLGMIEALEDEKVDVFILDRGLFDGLVWNDWLEKTKRLNADEAKRFRDFVLTPRWWNLTEILFVMHCDPKESLEREYAYQITNQPGSIMNTGTLQQLKDDLLAAVSRYETKMKHVEILDTSGMGLKEGVMKVAAKTLGALESFLDENVLCVPLEAFTQTFQVNERTVFVPEDWDRLKHLVDRSGEYIPRSAAEEDDEWIQIVPVCVIVHDGKLLTNLRHEPDESLHKTLANWAGGHVRMQDKDEGQGKWMSVITGLKREINEELELATLPDPEPVGLVRTKEDARAARHLGVVFRVSLEDTRTAAMLQDRTIRERPNKHVKTTWMDTSELRAEEDKQKDWSNAISEFFHGDSPR